MTETNPVPSESTPPPRRFSLTPAWLVAIIVAVAVLTFIVAMLLVSIFTRRQEAQKAFVRVVEVTENTVDPAIWGRNWPREYDSYKRTADATHTRYGGSEAMTSQKLDRDPWLKQMFSGYAFSLDYRDRRGHAYMLQDQEETERVKQRKQPGACLHCHASVLPVYRYMGNGDVMAGFAKVCAMPYNEARQLKTAEGKALVEHPVACLDCHDPATMQLRVTRPGFLNGIKALKQSQGIQNYDPNRDASRQEMRSFVCGQCHVEYYFKKDGNLLTYPWHKGLKVEQIEAYYDEIGFSDWKHGVTGAPMLKAQHPEFETFNQGIHARSGVACADCHMPYIREGAMKVSDHGVRSPLLMINRSCQTCHNVPEMELEARVLTIQNNTRALIDRSAGALVDMMDAVVAARSRGVTDEQLKDVWALHRKAQFRLDYVYAENSMGFHADQETARILAESIDYARQAQVLARALFESPTKPATTRPVIPPVEGVTPTPQAPAGGAEKKP